jgi:integrase/recombinase XerC
MIALKPEELRSMLSKVDVKAAMGPRDYFMLVLLYNTGLRVSELAGLNVHDCAFEGAPRAELHVSSTTAKGHRSRQVPMNSLAQKAVAKLLAFSQARGLSVAPEAPLLQTKHHRRISVRTIEWLVASLREKAGIDFKAVVHSFRHGFATNLAQSTNNLRVVQKALGHKRLNTVEVYTQVGRDDVARAAERMAHLM